MYLLDPTSAENYLRKRGELSAAESVRVAELAGGVSNEVLLVERGRGDRFVLKQAREQLRVPDHWKCDVRRIWREVEVLRYCGELLWDVDIKGSTRIAVVVPQILFEDRENFCYAMTAAPADHQTWKQRLLAGDLSEAVARAAGMLLSTLHSQFGTSDKQPETLVDRSYFQALRVEPYYERLKSVHPPLAGKIEELIDSMSAPANRCLVHGDFSPKNLLVFDDCLMLIDFEVGHLGDPAFDLGFFFTHLMLKSIWAGPRSESYRALAQAAWQAYRETSVKFWPAGLLAAVSQRAVRHLAACMLARVDGKSRVDYLSPDHQATVRCIATQLLQSPTNSLEEAFLFIAHEYDRSHH